ncbi:hypothetical protein [Sodalis sp. dw_96]|uniref:hypothetical protein n=1 Tax=Sodalis sp. dw_96 TaxID=2719794 RepID=UPI001BD27046|nr:hypothetical protein [Sodalis sp. dw_96]
MFRLTWNCFHQDKETGEIEPFIHSFHKNLSNSSRQVNITGVGNQPDVSLPTLEGMAPKGKDCLANINSLNGKDSHHQVKEHAGPCWAQKLSICRSFSKSTSIIKRVFTGGAVCDRDRLIPAQDEISEHKQMLTRARAITADWPPRLQQLAINVFKEQGLAQIEEGQLLCACIDLLSRFGEFPPPYQYYLSMQINGNIKRLSLNERYSLCYFVTDLANEGSFLCPTCHYLTTILDHAKDSILYQ